MDEPVCTVQLVTSANAALLENVDDDVFDNPINREFLREYLSAPSSALFVALVEGQVVGMATGIAYGHPDKARSLFINEVGVSARHHRRGIGTQLIASLLAWGRNKGCEEAWVATEIDNTAARQLYRSTGGMEDHQPAVVYVYSLADTPAAEKENSGEGVTSELPPAG